MSNINEIKILRRKINRLQRKIGRHQSLLNTKISRLQNLLSQTTSPSYKQQIIDRLNMMQKQEGGTLFLRIRRKNEEIAELENQIRILEQAP